MKLTRKTFLCTDRQLQILGLIQEKYGLSTTTAAFGRALSDGYSAMSKYGADPLRNGAEGLSGGMSIQQKAELKAEAKIAEKKAEEELKLQPKKQMCTEMLGGVVVDRGGGALVCEWQTHNTRVSEDQSISLSMVGDYLLNNLYIPDKETVLRARPDLK